MRVALILMLVAAPAAARDTFLDTLSGYEIEPRVLEAPNCAGPDFDDVRIESFERGVCTFHEPARSPESAQRAIRLLDEAQRRGLPPVHQQLATLLTGLAQCGEAARHLAAFRASNGQDLMERTLFCRDRRLSQAELNAIRWNHALFDYAEGLPPEQSLEARLTEMSACYAGPLAPGLDAECGLITNPSDAELDVFVEAATGEVIVTYFSGVESPVTAMFSRKLGRAEGLLESAAASIATLAIAAAAVTAEYQALNDVYTEARDSRMGPIYEAYRDAILRATAILDEFDRWKGGLFITAENINLLPVIAERGIELEEELRRVEELGFISTADDIVENVLNVVDAEERNQQTVATLCRVYFCELASRQSLAEVIRACRRPALAGNPLCIDQDGETRSGLLSADFEGTHDVEVTALCRGAGVDPAFLTIGMTPQTKAACLREMP